MIYPFDFHTHTNLCDGKDSIKDMIESAKNKKMKAIGFSGHSFTKFDTSYCMSEQNTKIYIEQINKAKHEFKEEIDVLCGIEKDYYSDIDTECFDYVIGSVHYVKCGEKHIDVDLSKDDLQKNVDKFYGGDFYAFCKDYYENVADVYNKTGCDILGHIDLVTKFNDNGALFDESDERYLSAVKGAVDKLITNDLYFEVNTGAISRGYKSAPYPSMPVLKYIVQSGGKLILSGDTHAKENLCFDFENAIEYIKLSGADKLYTIDGKIIEI